MEKDIFVTRSDMPSFEEFTEEIKDIWETHWLTNMGEKHNRLERELEGFLKVPHLSLMSNGHMALEMAIASQRLEGEVITTPYTFASTTHAIVRNNLSPVFCDIDPSTFCMDADKIEELITQRTSAIVPVHVYGYPCDVEKIERIAKKHHLAVIYDAAHAFGVEVNGRGIGSYGDISVFSFHATKVFNSIEGGAACFSDPKIGEELYHLKNFGIVDEEHVAAVGANAKFNEFQAAFGLCNLRHTKENIGRRKKVWELYTELLSGTPGILLPQKPEGFVYNYAYYPVIVDERKFGRMRDELFNCLAEKGIHARKYFYPLITEFDCYKERYDSKKTPEAKYVSEHVLTLPLYSALEERDVERICKEIRK